MVFRSVLVLTAVSAALVLLLLYAPGLIDINPVHINPPPPRPFVGPLAPNDALEKVTKLLKNRVRGPESLAVHQGILYTGSEDGWIVRSWDEKSVEPIVRVGGPYCDRTGTCGRPLGMRFDKNGLLYIVDGNLGLYTLDVSTGQLTMLYNNSEPVEGKVSKLPDDLDISSTGDIYFSDASTKFSMQDVIFELLETAPNGRVLHYDPRTKKTKLLVDNIAVANGIQLSPKEDFLLIAETTRNKILRYHLKGKDQGTLDVFADNLPGFPDNIRSNGKGGYWVALCLAHTPQHQMLLTNLGPHVTVRKILARAIDAGQTFIRLLHTLFPSVISEEHTVLPMGFLFATTGGSYGLILELDGQGEIVRSLHAPDGTDFRISQVTQYGNILYLGSPWNEFVGKVTL